ncbi:MAG: HDOD domain-containing protein [Fibrobacterota bacterium]
MTAKEEYLEEIVKVIELLPPLPESIIQLKKELKNRDVNFERIYTIIENDPSLTADILHIANSSFFNIGHTIDNPRTAIRFIGLNTVTNFITLQFSTRVIKKSFSRIHGLREYFNHSNNVANATKTLAQRAGLSRSRQESLYTAGLLHDIGRLVLIMALDPETVKLLSLNEWDHIDMHKQLKEKEILGINHCIAGKDVARKWAFPDSTQHIILNHHTPLKNEVDIDSSYVFLAHFLMLDSVNENMLLGIFPKDILQMMNLSEESLIQAWKQVQKETSN